MVTRLAVGAPVAALPRARRANGAGAVGARGVRSDKADHRNAGGDALRQSRRNCDLAKSRGRPGSPDFRRAQLAVRSLHQRPGEACAGDPGDGQVGGVTVACDKGEQQFIGCCRGERGAGDAGLGRARIRRHVGINRDRHRSREVDAGHGIAGAGYRLARRSEAESWPERALPCKFRRAVP